MAFLNFIDSSNQVAQRLLLGRSLFPGADWSTRFVSEMTESVATAQVASSSLPTSNIMNLNSAAGAASFSGNFTDQTCDWLEICSTRFYLITRETPPLSHSYTQFNTLTVTLYYFFIQLPNPPAGSNENGTGARQQTVEDSMSRIREVRYDRGNLAEEGDREAQRMASARERLRTIQAVASKCEADEAVILAGMGFYCCGTESLS